MQKDLVVGLRVANAFPTYMQPPTAPACRNVHVAQVPTVLMQADTLRIHECGTAHALPHTVLPLLALLHHDSTAVHVRHHLPHSKRRIGQVHYSVHYPYVMLKKKVIRLF